VPKKGCPAFSEMMNAPQKGGKDNEDRKEEPRRVMKSSPSFLWSKAIKEVSRLRCMPTSPSLS